jgi:hypothetical protein
VPACIRIPFYVEINRIRHHRYDAGFEPGKG